MMESGVYWIIHKKSGKSYVGSAKSLPTRWRIHKNQLKNNKHPNIKLQRAWNKYGEKAFVFQVLTHCVPENLISIEQFAIDVIKPEYNICQKAGSRLGVPHSASTKRKLQIARRKRIMTEETKKRIGMAHAGRRLSNEHKAKISKTCQGEGSNSAKLTEEDVRQIRTLLQSGHKQQYLADQFGVTQFTISDIKRHKSWNHV